MKKNKKRIVKKLDGKELSSLQKCCKKLFNLSSLKKLQGCQTQQKKTLDKSINNDKVFPITRHLYRNILYASVIVDDLILAELSGKKCSVAKMQFHKNQQKKWENLMLKYLKIVNVWAVLPIPFKFIITLKKWLCCQIQKFQLPPFLHNLV